ncbi:MAG: diacylglycerol kinase family protein [Armatimonadetes bacterium]|nr:diacylglycerol kinase family protein [Armatimonadota bacterium]
MRYMLIMNPGSRSGKGQRLWRIWESGLTRTNIDFTCVSTDGMGRAMELARSADFDVVVAVGGDGTINEILDGVIQSGNPNLQMGVLYSGTSPDFCKFHGIPIEPDQAVNALLSGRNRKVDVARITYHDERGRQITAHYGCSCNIGMGASVARFANKWRRYLGDSLGTGAGVIYTLAKNARVDIDLNIDGNICCLPGVNNLTIAKNPYIASGLKLALDISADDGKLCVFAMHGQGRMGVIRLLPKFYSGSVTGAKGMFLQECRSVTVTSKESTEIEFDGDPRGYLPVSIEILPQALTLIGGSNE